MLDSRTSRDPHHAFAAILTGQQTDEPCGGVLEAFDDYWGRLSSGEMKPVK